MAMSLPLAAQEQYRVVDMGTFGGPQGFLSEQVQVLNNQGKVAGYLDTSTVVNAERVAVIRCQGQRTS
jgi:hypothetical protein